MSLFSLNLLPLPHEASLIIPNQASLDIHEVSTSIHTADNSYVLSLRGNREVPPNRYSPERKARLVAKRFTQTYEVYYHDTFAPMAKMNTVRVLLSLVVNLDWTLRQFDVKKNCILTW
ncbi:unnamed protein product [Prunus brigantina]